MTSFGSRRAQAGLLLSNQKNGAANAVDENAFATPFRQHGATGKDAQTGTNVKGLRPGKATQQGTHGLQTAAVPDVKGSATASTKKGLAQNGSFSRIGRGIQGGEGGIGGKGTRANAFRTPAARTELGVYDDSWDAPEKGTLGEKKKAARALTNVPNASSASDKAARDAAVYVLATPKAAAQGAGAGSDAAAAANTAQVQESPLPQCASLPSESAESVSGKGDSVTGLDPEKPATSGQLKGKRVEGEEQQGGPLEQQGWMPTGEQDAWIEALAEKYAEEGVEGVGMLGDEYDRLQEAREEEARQKRVDALVRLRTNYLPCFLASSPSSCYSPKYYDAPLYELPIEPLLSLSPSPPRRRTPDSPTSWLEEDLMMGLTSVTHHDGLFRLELLDE